MSLTMSPPIRRSPLVCCSSPQMMRRNVVLPQPEGPSKTMNSPFGTSKLMPFTAGTSPNFFMMFLVDTAAIKPPDPQHSAPTSPSPLRAWLAQLVPRMESDGRSGPRSNARSGIARSGLTGPLFHNDLALLRGPLHCVLGAQLIGRMLRHHVVDDEGVIDLIHCRCGRSRIARNGRPLLGVLQDRELVVRRRGRIVR